MDYNFSEDLKAIREMLDLTQDDLAAQLGVEQVSISRSESGLTMPGAGLLEKVYGFAFENHIKLGALKEMLCAEDIKSGHKLLFHGSKDEINGPIDVRRGRANNDFGKGFYTGESYAQSVSFISAYDRSCVYFLDFDPGSLKCKRYEVNQEWMMTIAYYRGKLDHYKDHPDIIKLIKNAEECDYIIAPIADNRMFQIINSFIDGEITDEQCRHCLAATNLGYQYVFKRDRAVENLRLIERNYIPVQEKEYFKKIRSQDAKMGDDKVRLARRKYRGQGYYIDDILGE